MKSLTHKEKYLIFVELTANSEYLTFYLVNACIIFFLVKSVFTLTFSLEVLNEGMAFS